MTIFAYCVCVLRILPVSAYAYCVLRMRERKKSRLSVLMFERVQRASGLRISTQAAGRVEGRPGYAKIAGVLLYWAAQASCSHQIGRAHV